MRRSSLACAIMMLALSSNAQAAAGTPATNVATEAMPKPVPVAQPPVKTPGWAQVPAALAVVPQKQPAASTNGKPASPAAAAPAELPRAITPVTTARAAATGPAPAPDETTRVKAEAARPGVRPLSLPLVGRPLFVAPARDKAQAPETSPARMATENRNAAPTTAAAAQRALPTESTTTSTPPPTTTKAQPVTSAARTVSTLEAEITSLRARVQTDETLVPLAKRSVQGFAISVAAAQQKLDTFHGAMVEYERDTKNLGAINMWLLPAREFTRLTKLNTEGVALTEALAVAVRKYDAATAVLKATEVRLQTSKGLLKRADAELTTTRLEEARVKGEVAKQKAHEARVKAESEARAKEERALLKAAQDRIKAEEARVRAELAVAELKANKREARVARSDQYLAHLVETGAETAPYRRAVLAVGGAAFTTPKPRDEGEANEDAVAMNPERQLYAISDGVTHSVHSGPLARLLVRRWTTTPAESAEILRTTWLSEVQNEWSKVSSKRPEKGAWFNVGQRADATFLGARVVGDATNRRLEVLGIGDSMIFLVRKGQVTSSFPFQRSSDFKDLVRTLPSKGAPDTPIQSASWHLESEDEIFMTTDALGKWVFTELEGGRDPFPRLRDVKGREAWTTFVSEARAQAAGRPLDLDDTSVIRFIIPATP